MAARSFPRGLAWKRLMAAGRSSAGVAISSTSITGQTRSRLTRSEEHTSELQSLMRISYAVFCLKKKIQNVGPIDTGLDSSEYCALSDDMSTVNTADYGSH